MHTDIKIATYNIHMGNRPKAVVNNIKALAAQGVRLFCLQEVRRVHRKVSVSELLLKNLGQGWQMECFYSPKNNSFDFNVAMLWHAPSFDAISFENLHLPPMQRYRSWEKLIEMAKRRSMSPIRRGAMVGVFKASGKIIRISNVHLDWQGGFGQKANQISFLKSYLDSKPKVDYEVVCGDFNSIGLLNKTKRAKHLLSLIGEDFVNAHPQPRHTISSYQQLDYIFAKNFTVKEAQVLRLRGSDHYPVLATLNF